MKLFFKMIINHPKPKIQHLSNYFLKWPHHLSILEAPGGHCIQAPLAAKDLNQQTAPRCQRFFFEFLDGEYEENNLPPQHKGLGSCYLIVFWSHIIYIYWMIIYINSYMTKWVLHHFLAQNEFSSCRIWVNYFVACHGLQVHRWPRAIPMFFVRSKGNIEEDI